MGSVSKDVVVSLGMISFTTRVESAAYTEEFLTNICDDGHEPLAVKRPLTCDTCGPITMAHLKKAKREGGGFVVLTEAEIAALTEDGKPYFKKVQLVPYNMDEVLSNTGQGEKYYQLHPQTSHENYALLRQLILAYPGKAFMAKYSVRTKASMFMAQVKGDCILLQERTFVDNLKPVPTFDYETNQDLIPLAIQMVESMATEFDPKTFADTYTQNLVKLTRSRDVIGGRIDKTAPVTPQVTHDLVREALLEYRIRKQSEISADV